MSLGVWGLRFRDLGLGSRDLGFKELLLGLRDLGLKVVECVDRRGLFLCNSGRAGFNSGFQHADDSTSMAHARATTKSGAVPEGDAFHRGRSLLLSASLADAASLSGFPWLAQWA